MMECSAIRQRFSDYLEGIASSEEKKRIEEHLLSCQPCSVVLKDLKKAGELVRDLKEVEPPPWMTQKVLARIKREQEAKKGIFEKLFFPLRIKIPIQATATVLIAVLAIYVFKAGEPELKKAQSPTVTDELASKDESLRQPSAPASEVQTPGGKTVQKKSPGPGEKRDVSRQAEEKQKEKGVLPGRDEAGEVARPLEAPSPKKPEAKLDEATESVGSTGQGISKQPAPPVAGVKKTERYGAAKDSLARERKAPAGAVTLRAAAAKRAEVVSIRIQVRDVKMAAGEIEDLLHQFGATRVEKESLQDAEVVTAELPSEKIEELIAKLRFKGEIKEEEPPSRIPKGRTSVRVEILSVP